MWWSRSGRGACSSRISERPVRSQRGGIARDNGGVSVVEGVPQPPSKAPGRLLLWLGLVVALGLGVGAAALSWRAYSSELGRREDGLEASAQLAAKSLDQFFSSRITLLESIARLPGTKSGDPVLITPGLDAVATEDNGFAVGMGYIDSEGLLRVQSTDGCGNTAARGPVGP